MVLFQYFWLVCSYFAFIRGSVLEDCAILRICSFLLGCSFYWHIIVFFVAVSYNPLYFFVSTVTFFIHNLKIFIIVDLQCSVNCCYTAKWPSHSFIYILFLTLSFIMLHHKWLDIVPCAIQPDLIAYPIF